MAVDGEFGVPAVWRVGDVIDGRYRVALVHGRGGMGLVYRVRHLAWGIDLAVKCPRPELFTSAADRERFVTEAETWVSLGLHPNVCGCYYVRTMGGIPRVFAEYVTGGSLQEWIHDRRLYRGTRRKALARIMDVAIQTAWGLAHAHDRGLVHQDVKPDNVLLDDHGQDLTAKVTDFGLARAQAATGTRPEGERPSDRTLLVPTAGLTPVFASPEQLARKALGRRSDIYSFAVSVLQMFTGGVDWTIGSAAGEVLTAYRADGPRRRGLPRAPGAVAELLRRCLEQDPARRPRTMADVADSLTDLYREAVGRPYPRVRPAAADLRADEWNNRALSLVDLGRPAQAEEAFTAALTADPRHVRATYNAGMGRWRRGEISDVGLLAGIEAVRADTGDPWQARHALLQVQLERADLDAARALADGLVREQPAEPEVQDAVHTLRSGSLTGAGCVERRGLPWAGHPPAFRTTLRLTPDLRFAFVGSRDGMLRLWDVRSGKCPVAVQGHEGAVRTVDVSADGRFALSGGGDEVVAFWDLTEGRCLGRAAVPGPEGRPAPGAIRQVRLSGDASLALCSTSYGKIFSWEFRAGRGRAVLAGPEEHGRTLEVSGDGRWALASNGLAENDAVRLWDLSTGQLRHVLRGARFSEPLSFGPDGASAVTSGADGKILIWDVDSGTCVRTLGGHSTTASAVSLSSDGRHAISGGRDKSLRFWELRTGRCLRTFEGLENEPLAVAPGPDGRHAVSVDADAHRTWALPGRHSSVLLPSRPRAHSEVTGLRARVAELTAEAGEARASGRYAHALELLTRARDTTGFERDPELLAAWRALGRSAVRVGLRSAWPGRALHAHDRHLHSVDVSGDGRIAVTSGSDRTARLWDLDSGACIRVLDGHSHHTVASVRLSADGRYVLTGCQDGTVRLWRAADGACLRVLDGHLHGVLWLGFSPDGRSALVGAGGNMVRLWDLESARAPMTLEAARGQADTAGATDGRRLVAHRGYAADSVQLWDLDSGEGLLTLRGHAEQLTSVCLSADQRTVLSGERTIRLWDTASGQCLRVFDEQPGRANAVRLSADGRFAVSGHSDSLVRVWDVGSGRCVRVLEGHRTSVVSVAWTPGGRFVLSGEEDGTVQLWELDWDLAAREPADWDDSALPHVEAFLAWHPPRLADRDVDTLLGRLRDAGYGWLRPDGVRAQLHRMASAPSLPSPREEQQALLTVTVNPGPGLADLKLKPVGLFRQMYEGWLEHLPSIHEARTEQVLDDRDRVIAYMKTEEFGALDYMSAVPDLLDQKEFVLGGPSLHTDGVWVWRTDSIHYFEKHRLEIPEEFLRHVRAGGYRPRAGHTFDFDDLEPFR
ncbi:protein kinase [Streptomyces filamentosus]|uniref:Protein kinase n=2 Tax=Streptomyces filamentosus TaxID=67294 RepID=A0ABY4UN59_STRFL|nr:protein kinase [Streptomyces filamentosus]EFE79217.1 protein kinase [Streptomyces filamentosus NRRL 15998]USC45532.1 protein kinase [Streptomyces filamentosus]